MDKLDALNIIASSLGHPEALDGADSVAEAIVGLSKLNYDITRLDAYTVESSVPTCVCDGLTFSVKNRGLACLSQIYATMDATVTEASTVPVNLVAKNIPLEGLGLSPDGFFPVNYLWEHKTDSSLDVMVSGLATVTEDGADISYSVPLPAAGDYVLHALGILVA